MNDEKVEHPCEKCTRKERFCCTSFKSCPPWIAWVGYEWRKIQATFEDVMKGRKHT